MTRDAVAHGFRITHDIGLAAWLGGSMFGKLALNPAVAHVSSRAERGKVVNAAWGSYRPVNATALAAVGGAWFAARLTEASGGRQSEVERELARVKDGLVVGALASGAATAVQGGRLSRQAPDGGVPIERGTEPAAETPKPAARIQRTLGLLSSANVAFGLALVAVNAMLAQQAHSRPPRRRALLRRSG
jgi:hypothetical protein